MRSLLALSSNTFGPMLDRQINLQVKANLDVDGNGYFKGFVKNSEAGIISDLPKDTILSESDVLIGV